MSLDKSMVPVYDPENELSDADLEALGKENFDAVLEYLDAKSRYLQCHIRPMSSSEQKHFRGLAQKVNGRVYRK